MEILYENECILFSLILSRKKCCFFCCFFFLNQPFLFFSRFSLWLNVYVCELAGNALQLPSAEEKPVRGQGSLEEGSRHKSIFISFSSTFAHLLLVLLLHRERYGSLGLARCLLTTLAALMVIGGNSVLCPPFSCVHEHHICLVLVQIDVVDQKEVGGREHKGSDSISLSWTFTLFPPDPHYVYHWVLMIKQSW